MVGFRNKFRDNFGDNFSALGEYQVQAYLITPNMIRDRFGDAF